MQLTTRGGHIRGHRESNSVHDRAYGAHDRVYEGVKARIIAHEPPSGRRIQTGPLAEELFVSVTPVREALTRLAAERVIEEIPKAGFFVKEVSESEIADLYRLQQLLLEWTLSDIRQDGRAPGILKPPDLARNLRVGLRQGKETPTRLALRVELEQGKETPARLALRVMNELTLHIARQSGNADVIHIVGNINDRTYYVRMKDHEAFGDPKNELLRLCQAYYRREFDGVSAGLKVCFREKILRLPELLRQLRGALPRTPAE